MCGGVIFTDLKTPAVTQRVTQATPWPEKKKARRGGGEGLRFTGLDGFGVELRVEDNDVDSEEFKVDSRDSVLDLGHGGVAEDDDDARSSRSIRSPSSRDPSAKRGPSPGDDCDKVPAVIMCGGGHLADVEVPAVTRKVAKASLCPEKKKPRRSDGGGRHFTGLGGRRGPGLDEEEEDFEADFKEFEANYGDSDLELERGGVAEKDDDNEVIEIKPFATVKRSLPQDDLSTTDTAGFDGPLERPAKRKRKNQFRGIRQRLSGKWAAEIRDPSKGFRVWLGTYNSAEEAARAYDVEARRIHGKKAKVNFLEQPAVQEPKAPKPSAGQKPTVTPAVNNLATPNAFVYPSANFASNQPLVQLDNVPFVLAMNSAAPVEAPIMNMYSNQGSNTFGGSDLGWEYDIKTPDISSIAPISTIAEGAESALVQSNTYNPVVIAEGVESVLVQSNTYNSVVPPVMENDAVDFEAWMRFFMDDGVDEPIDSLLNFDVPQDVIGNMDLWNFDDMPICGDFF